MILKHENKKKEERTKIGKAVKQKQHRKQTRLLNIRSVAAARVWNEPPRHTTS